jgi:hypothetical protein
MVANILLGVDDTDSEIQSSRTSSTIAGDYIPEANRAKSSIRKALNGERDTALSKFTTKEIVDKRQRGTRIEYKCAFEPLWLAKDLVETAQMGRACVQSYENGLIRAGRLETLRERKRKSTAICDVSSEQGIGNQGRPLKRRRR